MVSGTQVGLADLLGGLREDGMPKMGWGSSGINNLATIEKFSAHTTQFPIASLLRLEGGTSQAQIIALI